ncbi:MAG: hypothetical protein ACKVQK_04365 [Burkholderiales bacterium]
MGTAAQTIDHKSLTQLIQSGAIGAAEIIGRGNAWGVVVSYGKTKRSLAARRGSLRTFRKFETLVSYLKDLGLSQFKVNAIEFDPNEQKTRRPDAALRLRGAFEAKAHADWIREKAAASLADPEANIPHRQVMAVAQTLIDSKKKANAGKARS